MRTLALLTALLATASACRSDCHPKASPRLDVGTGELGYQPLDPDAPAYDLVHGPQGGWHVLIGLDAAGLDATQVIVAEMIGRIDDQVVAANENTWLTFTCEPAPDGGESLQTANIFLIFDVEDHCGLDGQILDVQVTLPDSSGDPLVGTTSAEILDPEWDTCE